MSWDVGTGKCKDVSTRPADIQTDGYYSETSQSRKKTRFLFPLRYFPLTELKNFCWAARKLWKTGVAPSMFGLRLRLKLSKYDRGLLRDGQVCGVCCVHSERTNRWDWIRKESFVPEGWASDATPASRPAPKINDFCWFTSESRQWHYRTYQAADESRSLRKSLKGLSVFTLKIDASSLPPRIAGRRKVDT